MSAPVNSSRARPSSNLNASDSLVCPVDELARSGDMVLETAITYGGFQKVFGGGMIVEPAPGSAAVYVGGAEVSGAENVPGALDRYSNGVRVVNGGSVVVESGNLEKDAIVMSGGNELVESGGTADGTTLSGGTEIVRPGGIVRGIVNFVSSGELVLDQSTSFGGTIAGLSNTSEKLDLTDISFGQGTSMTYSGNTLSGTLSVTDGSKTANIHLLGNYTTANFTSASDGNGGTLIADPPPHEVSVPGSNLFFANTYAFDTTTTLGQEYLKCILAAEQTFASLWTTPAYITLTFGLADLGGFQNGWITLAQNVPTALVNVSYAQLRSHLTAQENVGNNYYGQLASQNLPLANPATGNATWALPEAYARMLGLSTATYSSDDTITINSNPSTGLTFDQYVTNSLEHELSECAMGRIGGLGDQPLGYQTNIWSTMDLFRYSAMGPDYSDGRGNALNPHFSYNGGSILSAQSFNDRFGPNPPNDPTGDTADFINTDVFGEGTTGVLSQADVETMDVLGWTPSSNVLWAGGVSGSFATVSNWLQANVPGVPSPNNDVIIDPFWGAFGSPIINPYTVSSVNNETINSLTTGPMATLAVSGGTFAVTRGGNNSGTIIVTSGARLSLGGFVNNAGTVEASGGTISLTGQLTVAAGGSALNTSVLSGASQLVDSGGYASGAVVVGTQVVYLGATASATTISAGGINIVNGGVVQGDIVDSGGLEQINIGSALATTVNSGGTETIEGQGLSPTTLIGTTVNRAAARFSIHWRR